MTKKELEELLTLSNLEVVKNAFSNLPKRSSLEVAQDWYNNLNGVKFSDWGKDLFSYSPPIKEIKIPTEIVIPCLDANKKQNIFL